LGKLVGEGVGDGRDAGIALNHAFIGHQKSAPTESNRINGLVWMQISWIMVKKSAADANPPLPHKMRLFLDVCGVPGGRRDASYFRP